jgi:hypothetical protein
MQAKYLTLEQCACSWTSSARCWRQSPLLDRRLIDPPPDKSKNKRRKLVEIPENLAAWLRPQAKTEGSIMPRVKAQVATAMPLRRRELSGRTTACGIPFAVML